MASVSVRFFGTALVVAERWGAFWILGRRRKSEFQPMFGGISLFKFAHLNGPDQPHRPVDRT
jgi:hypothetical protein